MIGVGGWVRGGGTFPVVPARCPGHGGETPQPLLAQWQSQNANRVTALDFELRIPDFFRASAFAEPPTGQVGI